MRELIRQKIADSLQRPIPALTRRDVRVPLVPGKVIAVIGMRRTGKTTFLWQLLADRVASGARREDLLYFAFEDERLTGLRATDLDVIRDEFERARGQRAGDRAPAWFLDEIQLVQGWETFVRRMHDEQGADLIVSGSSARLLSREVATSLRGRGMEAIVYPFSFREYLRHLGIEPVGHVSGMSSSDRSRLQSALRGYLVTGGFPEAQGLEARDRHALLSGYVDAVLLRDIVERHQVSNPVALRWMVRHLLANPAGTFSISKFHADLTSQGLRIGKDTCHDFLSFLEDAFLVQAIPVASSSLRRRMRNARKAYPVDPGLIPVFDRSSRSNLGHALETCILLELQRRGAEIGYVIAQDGSEIDFHAHHFDGTEELIQACVDASDTGTYARETRALLSAAADYPRAARKLITLEPLPPTLAAPGIEAVLALDWLLG